MTPRSGDVLISNRGATISHEVSVAGGSLFECCPNRARALARGHQIAGERGVDLWLTEDLHFMQLASYRAQAAGQERTP